MKVTVEHKLLNPLKKDPVPDNHSDAAVTVVEYVAGGVVGGAAAATLGSMGIGVAAPAIMPVILGGSIIATSAVLPFAAVGVGAGLLAVGTARFVGRLFTRKPAPQPKAKEG